MMVRLPEASTVPIPLSIVTLAAFAELQEIVVDCPFSIADGDAVREMVGDGEGGGDGNEGGSSAFVAAGVAAVGFFAQPVPEISKADRMIAVASMYGDLLISGISFPCLSFVMFALKAALLEI